MIETSFSYYLKLKPVRSSMTLTWNLFKICPLSFSWSLQIHPTRAYPPAYFYLHNNVMPLNNSNLCGDIVLVCEIRAGRDTGVLRKRARVHIMPPTWLGSRETLEFCVSIHFCLFISISSLCENMFYVTPKLPIKV